MSKKSPVFDFPKDLITSLFNVFGMKVSRKEEKKILKALSKFASKAKMFNQEKLLPVIEVLKDLQEPIISMLEIAATMIRPLIAIIPPQYLIIIVGIILIPTVFIPLQIVGMSGLYALEDLLKVPFSISKYRYDKFPDWVAQNKFMIRKKVVLEKTFKMLDFFNLDPLQQKIWMHDMSNADKIKLRAILTALGSVDNPEDFIGITQETPFNLPFLEDLFTIPETITVRSTYYRGVRRILPPVMHFLIGGILNIVKKFQESELARTLANLPDERPALTQAFAWFMTGPIGFLITRGIVKGD